MWNTGECSTVWEVWGDNWLQTSPGQLKKGHVIYAQAWALADWDRDCVLLTILGCLLCTWVYLGFWPMTSVPLSSVGMLGCMLLWTDQGIVWPAVMEMWHDSNHHMGHSPSKGRMETSQWHHWANCHVQIAPLEDKGPNLLRSTRLHYLRSFIRLPCFSSSLFPFTEAMYLYNMILADNSCMIQSHRAFCVWYQSQSHYYD